MTVGEQLSILEGIIYSFAKDQFDANKVPYTLAQLVMRGVAGRFQDGAINELLAEIMQSAATEKQVFEKKTGTKEELLKDFAERVGFVPDEHPPGAGQEESGGNAE